jgi:general stress protein CsbA
MTFLLAHWHCIVPVVVLVIGTIIINRKNKSKSEEKDD